MSIACLLFCSATLAALLRSCRIVCPALSSRSTQQAPRFLRRKRIGLQILTYKQPWRGPQLVPVTTYFNKGHW